MADDNVTVSRAEVSTKAAARGTPYSDDQLQRWTDAVLVAASRPIPNSLERGYTEAEAEGILRVAAIAASIGSKRAEHREIAFRLAFQGFAAPPELVLEFLEDSVSVFQSRMKRLLTNRGNRYSDSPTFVEVVSTLLTNWVFRTVKQKRSEGSPSAELLRTLFALLVSAMFSRSEATLFKLFETLVRRRFPNAAPEASTALWKLLHDVFELFRLDDKSSLVHSVRGASSTPEVAVRAARDAGLLLGLAGRVIPWFYEATPANTGGWCSEEECEWFNRYFPPVAAVVLMTLGRDAAAQERLQKTRDGDVDDLVSDLHAIKALATTVSSDVLERSD